MAQKKVKPDDVSLKVSVNLLESKDAEKAPRSVAYAFSSGGRLLARGVVDEEGTASLTLPVATEARSVRVIVGPEVDEEATSISGLLRRGAEEKFLRINPEDLAPSVEIVVFPDKWLCWLLSLCFVRGTLLKRQIIGGVPVDLPVCNATVEIYEVDPIPIIIARLPDYVIEKIRDIILNPPPPPPPPPDGPFPPPPPDGPFPPIPPGPNPEPVFGSVMSFAVGGAATSSAGTDVGVQAKAIRSISTASDLQLLASNTDTFQFRRALPDYATLIAPILCLFYPMVTKTLVATATTDDCGRFQTFFFRGCNNPDTPDLYFKAKQSFGYFTFTIYAPTPVPCFTHWNYECGTEVTLYTTHPLALTCSPCPPVIAPNNWVLVMALGNLPLSRIHGTSVPLQASTTPANLGLTDNGAPFGELLRLRIEFDNSLREDLDVKYYRVSYLKGTSGSFTPMTVSVHRHYTHEVGGDLVLEVYNLGPKVINGESNLFEIPPALPPTGQWSFPDLLEDLTSAKFPTTDLAPLAAPGIAWPEHGKYQLKVDLFDKDGNLVDIDAAGMQIKYRVPAVTDLSGDIDTDDAATLGLVTDDDSDGKKSFIMTLHIDNSRCLGGIDAPTLGGIAADDDCGVLEYDPASPGSVVMQYTAQHPNGLAPNGFATYRFRVFRGVNNLTLPPLPASPTLPASGRVPIPPASFSNTQTVEHLMGGCSVAGFSENLDVWAMATDGWQRLGQYDAHAVRAFVLSPEEEE
jgi:hypothetical protein